MSITPADIEAKAAQITRIVDETKESAQNTAVMAGAALFGFLIRLGLITIAVLLVRNEPWVELVPLGISLIISHLGLLFWEMRFVSASLAFPGLKPTRGEGQGR